MPSKRSQKTHDDCLKLVCFFCHKKAPNRRLSTNQRDYISRNLFQDFEHFKELFPSGVCENCSRICNDLIKNGSKASKKFPLLLDYREILRKLQNIPTLTRLRPTCDCFICQVVKVDCIAKVKPEKVEKKRKCPNCFAILKPGGHKNCSRPERVKNLMQDLTPKTRMQLALQTLRDERDKKNSSSPLKISKSSGGHGTTISVGKNCAANIAEDAAAE